MDDTPVPVSRREFLYGASAAAFVTALHEGASADAAPAAPAAPHAASAPRILDLHLRTATPLAELKAFYRERIGFAVAAETTAEITFAAGQTLLTFTSSDPAEGRPFYHFAFNIPENKIRLARAWQRERSELITTPPHLRDAAYPDDVRHFSSWNAHSVFFWDPAGNLVEYIARHDLTHAAEGEFSTSDILHASEIGFVVEESRRNELSHAIQASLGLPGYAPTRQDGYFWALGDVNGLLLLLPRGPRSNVDPTREVVFDVFPTEATIAGAGTVKHAVEGYPYRIVSA